MITRIALTLAAFFAPFFVFPSAMLAQSTPSCNTAAVVVCSEGTASGSQRIKPQAVPTTPTRVTYFDAYLDFLVVSSSTATTITVTDGNGVSILNGVAIAANTVYSIQLYGSWQPGGFSVSASSSGATIQGRYRT